MGLPPRCCVSWVALAAAALFLAFFSPRVLPEELKWFGFKESFTYQCHKDIEGLNVIASVHKNAEADRRFSLGCGRIPKHLAKEQPNCQWIENVKGGLRQPSTFQCDKCGYINGIKSKYDEGTNDRVFEYRCCSIENTNNTWCSIDAFVTDVEEVSLYVVDNDWVLKGVESRFDKDRKDRQYRFKRCELDYKSS